MSEQGTESEEFEELYIRKANELTKDSPDPEAGKKLWLQTRKSFTDEELRRNTREVLVQLRQNYYATFAAEQLGGDGSLTEPN